MKPAARKGDHHACADNGPNMGAHLLVEEGSTNITINGKPAARVGDTVSCRLTTDKNPVIAEGSPSVFFNGKPAARMGDRVEKGGSVSSGSGNVFIGDSGTLITVGDNIDVTFGDGCGIYLNCGSPADASFKIALSNALSMVQMAKQTTPALSADASNTLSTTTDAANSETPSTTNTTPQTASTSTSPDITQCSAEVNITPPPASNNGTEEEYEYYVVTAEGLKTKLAVFSLTQLLFDFAGVDVTDYFEEGRWMMSEPDLGEKSNEKINQAKEQYNRQQLRDKNRSAWKGKYKPAQTASTEIPVARELTPVATVKVGVAGGLVAGLSWLQKGAVRKDLLTQIKLRHTEVKTKMQNNDGVLIETHYILRPIDNGISIKMDSLTVLGGYPDYIFEIKKQMTVPFIENKYDSITQHEFLFVWAVKK